MSNDHDLLREHYRKELRQLNLKIISGGRNPRRNEWFAARRVLVHKLANFDQEHKSIHPETYGDW